MSLFSDFIDQSVLDEVDTGAQYGGNEDGVYVGTVADVYPREGTDNFPDRKWIIVEYALDNGSTETEWFQTPDEPGNPTEAEQQKLGFLIRRMGDLGVERNRIGSFQPDEVIGLRVAITLRTTNGKGRNAGKKFQNVNSVKPIPAQTGGAVQAPPTRAQEPQFQQPAAQQPQRAAGGTRRPNPAARRQQ